MKNKLFYKMIFFLLALSALTGCSAQLNEKKQFSAHSMDYFDTVITVTGYESTKEEFDRTSKEILSLLGEYHKLYTIYNRFEDVENLCTINELEDGAHRTVRVDSRIVDMLLFSKEMYSLTKGRVNIAMGSVLSLWHEYRSIGTDNPIQAKLPPVDKLYEASQHTDINNLVVDEQHLTVTLSDPMMRLDVGAIAKGYATEQVARYLEENGVCGYVLNVGGNVRTIGTKPDGSPWTVGLENPDGGDYLEYLSLSGESVVTSGSYQRFYYVDGQSYHHIIDTETLMPARGFESVSVICEDSGLGDALSTALFCMSLEEGMSLVESIPDTEAMWLSEDGERFVSSGWSKYVKQ